MLIICSTFIITFFITGKLDLTIAITLVANLTNTVLYFFHERLWDAIHWGKIKA